MLTLPSGISTPPAMHTPADVLANVAIVVVAYNAELTICSVLDRIPGTFIERLGAILISDDGSLDRTAEIARTWARTHPPPMWWWCASPATSGMAVTRSSVTGGHSSTDSTSR